MKKSCSDELTAVVLLRSRISPAMLFRAWIDPLILPQWLAPPPYNLVGAKVDARVGGDYRHDIEGPDGTHTVAGRFLDLVPERRLRKSWIYSGPNPAPRSEPTCVTVDIEAAADGTTMLALTHSGLRDAIEESHYREGWHECFRRLERLHAPKERVLPEGSPLKSETKNKQL